MLGKIIQDLKLIWSNIASQTFFNYWEGKIGQSGKHIQIQPNSVIVPDNLYMEDNTRLQNLNNMISNHGKVVIKKYGVVSSGCILVPGAHTPTVGVPQFLSILHINDVEQTITVGEDAWVGAGCILLSHCKIGRGAVVGAGSVVSKDIPPYAVVVGSPAKIIGVKFSIEQILKHESILYPPEERMSRSELDELFSKHFEGKRIIGTSYISESDKEKLLMGREKFGITDYSNL